MKRSALTSSRATRPGLWAGAALLGAALTATWVERRSRRAERTHPPVGQLLEIDGVRGWSVATKTRACGVSSRGVIAAGAGAF